MEHGSLACGVKERKWHLKSKQIKWGAEMNAVIGYSCIYRKSSDSLGNKSMGVRTERTSVSKLFCEVYLHLSERFLVFTVVALSTAEGAKS